MAVNSAPPQAAFALHCRLCTLPVRAPVVDDHNGTTDTFCCAGCRNVWRILLESGQLEGFDDPRDSPLYRQALEAGIISQGGLEAQSAPVDVVAGITAERKGSALDDNRQCILQIDGMWCSSCAWLISQTLLRRRGVVSAEVSFSSDTARIVFKPAKTDETVLTKTVKDLGYGAAPLGESNDDDPRTKARRRDFLRVVICFAFAMNVMMTQLILYAGFFEGITRDLRTGIPWLLLALSSPVFITASPIFYRAVQAARQGAATMETLVAIGSGAAFCYSVWQTVQGTGHVYYDTADMLLGLVMVGKHIESGARQNANDALTLLYGLLPHKAVILKDGREFPVAIAQLADGDTIVVKAGERIAADGTVLTGDGTVDESLLSGESRPVNKRRGDKAIGGTMLMNGFLQVAVDRTGEAGTLSLIIKHVSDAIGSKTPTERMADRISRIFVPSVLVLAGVAGLLAVFVSHDLPGEVMTRIVAVLVIACPCALGIATPMAISAGVASAAKQGILVSDGGAFELLKNVKHMVIDKTGTATEASFEVRRVWPGNDRTEVLTALERCSAHPIASSVAGYFALPPPGAMQVLNFAIEEGAGISGVFEGHPVYAGNERAVQAMNAEISPDQRAFADACSAIGLTVIYWGQKDDHVSGIIALGDRLRDGAIEAITSLSDLGITAELLSGDSPEATAFAANQMKIDKYQGGVSPTEKASFVESLKSPVAKVCMVGDGVNDAPALAQADIGIALASGTDIAARTAQITLLTPDLLLLPKIVRIARRTVAVMHMNIFWAFLYNIICIPLAMLGYVTPLWAVIAMIISSLTVILNTQRLGRG